MRISDWSSDVCSSDLILALFGENITPAAAVAIGLRAEYVFLDHFLEPFREDIASDSEALLEVAEALLAVKGFAHEQQGPPVAHDLERARDAAGCPAEIGPFSLHHFPDRKSVVWGKGVSGRVDLGGLRI